MNVFLKRLKTTAAVLCACLLLLSRAAAQYSPDDEKILNAQHAIDAYGNCEAALKILDQVSESGKKQYPYLLWMAKAYDCSRNTDMALFYYQKCLEIKPDDITSQTRVNEINRQKQAQQEAAEERERERQQRAREAEAERQQQAEAERRQQLQDRANEIRAAKEATDVNLEDGYILVGIGYNHFLGDTLAPCLHAAGLQFSIGMPIINDRVILDYSTNLSVGLQANPDWVYHAFNKKATDFNSIGYGGSYLNISLGLMPILISGDKVALTIGPELGVGMLSLTSVDIKNAGFDSYDYDNTPIFNLLYGAKLNLFIGSSFVIRAEYINCTTTTTTTTLNFNPINTANINYGQFQVGVGLKFRN